jgi:hypothetical protein
MSGNIPTNQVVSDVEFEIEGQKYLITLVVLPGMGIDVMLGMNWMSQNGTLIYQHGWLCSEILLIRKVF